MDDKAVERGALPPGQHMIATFPRFGASPFAERFPPDPSTVRLAVSSGGVPVADVGPEAWSALPRRRQVSDFHCVTTWTRRGCAWAGVGFADFAEALGLAGGDPARLVVMHASDGYHAALPLGDLLAADVVLADRLDGAALPVAHGAPLRLVAPAHYGYKSVKHLARLTFDVDPETYRALGPKFMIHPRGRVALEERGRGFPGWLLRFAYRPLIAPTTARFARALARYQGPV